MSGSLLPGMDTLTAPATTSPPPTLRQVRLTLAVEGWTAGERRLYQPGHALFLALLRHADPTAAAALHDGVARKPFALGPLHVVALPGGLGRGELTIRSWDDGLAALVERAGRAALDAPLSVVGHPAAVVSLASRETTTPAALLAAVEAARPRSVRVEFASPTLFGLGRYADGSSRHGLLPEPGLVVASWLRAWTMAGGVTFGADPRPEWLAERVALLTAAVQVVSVNAGKTALSGFVGTAAYAWRGPEAWGPALLAALARFAAYCGTGAKTAQGFGVTLPRDAGAPAAGRMPGTGQR